MKTYELTPVNGRASFGGKCKVNEFLNDKNETQSDLISYSTKVASFNHLTKELQIFGYYPATTTIHINAFLHKFGFDLVDKKTIKKYIK